MEAKMALQFLAIALLVAFANGQPAEPTPDPNDPSGPLITYRGLTGAEQRELELEQNPELLALAATLLSRILIEIGSATQTAVVVEGVNVNIDCYNWLINFPGGTTRWFFQGRDIFGELDAMAAPQTSGERVRIGGMFNRWLNITSTIIAASAEVPSQGDYICQTCIARGTPFEMCHNATVTLHLLGAPPFLDKGDGTLVRADPNDINTVIIGNNLCINETDPESFNVLCNILTVNLAAGIREVRPLPFRTWVVNDEDGDVLIYNATQGQTPDFNPGFFEAGLRILFREGIVEGVPIFELGTTGGFAFNPDITFNATEASGLPDSQRVIPVVRRLIAQEIVGSYTCMVENVFGSDVATTVISFCGEAASLPGCPSSILTPEDGDVVPVGCTVCIARNSEVTLDCTADGSEIGLAYTWTDERGRFLSASAMLTVDRTGNFTCVAMNADGTAVRSSDVRYAPSTVFYGRIRNTFGMRRDNGCGRLNPEPANPPDLCGFVGETIRLNCRNISGHSLEILEGGSVVEGDVVLNATTAMMRTFSCAHSETGACAQDPAMVTVRIYDPARINRQVGIGGGEFGAGRTNSVEVVDDGDLLVLRCPISGIEDPVGAWSFISPTNMDGRKEQITLDDNSPGITITTNTSDEITLTINSYDASVHNGIYVCRASNSAGSDEGIISLTNVRDDGVWDAEEFKDCNINCRDGIRVRSVVCRSQRDGRILPETECAADMPPRAESCANAFPQECLLTPIFVAGQFGRCSEDCKGGFRKRDVRCVVPMTGEERPFQDCRWSNQRRPPSTEFCPNTCCVRDDYDGCWRIGPDLCNMNIYQQLCCWTCLLRVRP